MISTCHLVLVCLVSLPVPVQHTVAPGLDSGLGLPPFVWLLLTILTCLALFFKFQRIWSLRNLDLLLLFTLAPGLIVLASHRNAHEWWAFVWLFLGTAVWLARCLLDLGLARRPLLEPNLNVGGLAFFYAGLLSLILIETMIIPEQSGTERNPGDPHARSRTDDQAEPEANADSGQLVTSVITRAIRSAPTLYLKRTAAALGHLGICLGLVLIGWKHYERITIGLAMAVAYQILPYTRIALVDSGQLVPAALLVLAVFEYRRPGVAGGLIGMAAGWMPAAIGLIPLWTGFYWRRGSARFLVSTLAVLGSGRALALAVPEFGFWARDLGARTLGEAGLLPGSEEPAAESFWTGVDPAYRLPVLVLYLAFVVASVWPMGKNLGQLIAMSAALLLGSQFWYLDDGGALIVLYLPMVLLLIFRPNLSAKFPDPIVQTTRKKWLPPVRPRKPRTRSLKPLNRP